MAVDVAVENPECVTQRERERCATWCEHMARMLENGAAKLRAEGAFTYHTWALKKVTGVRPRWEYAARERDEVAKIVRQVKTAIEEGLEPKPLD